MLDPQAVLRGETQRVVLYPDSSRHPGRGTLESMELRHFFVRDSMALGVSSYDHAWHRPGAQCDPGIACAYAYGNFGDLVFNCNLGLKLLRGYHAKFYEKIRFTSVRDYETAWDSASGGALAPVRDAIEAGRKIKVAIRHADGLWTVHPVHLPTATRDATSFELFTDQASYPTLFRTLEAIKHLSDTIAGQLEAFDREARTKPVYAAPDFELPEPEFASVYCIVRADGTYARGRLLTDPPAFAPYDRLVVFASLGPA